MKTSTSLCLACLLVCLLCGASLAEEPLLDLQSYCVRECDLLGQSAVCDCDDLADRGLTSAFKRGGAFPFRYGKRDLAEKRQMPFRYGKRSLESSHPWWARNAAANMAAALSDHQYARSLIKRQFRYGKRSVPSSAAAFMSQDARSAAKRQFRYGKRSAPNSVADLLGYNFPKASALTASSSEAAEK